MSEIQEKNSGSDVSTGSWTLLEDIEKADEPNLEQSSGTIDNNIEIVPENENKTTEAVQDASKKGSNGFLTFDEYLQERLLDENEETPKRVRKSGKIKMRKIIRKGKAENFHISVLFAIVAAMSLLAAICSNLSQPPPKKEVHSVKNAPAYKELVRNVDEVVKDLEHLKSPKLPPSVKDKTNDTVAKNITDVLKPAEAPKNETLASPKTPKEFPKCEASGKPLKANKIKSRSKTTWSVLKEVLFDTNLHCLLSLILTNYHMLDLLTELTRKRHSKKAVVRNICSSCFLEELEKGGDIEQFRAFLFKQLPFWNAEFSAKDQKKKQVKKANAAKRTKTVAVLNLNKKTFDSIVSRSCPHFFDHDLPPVTPTNEETGKSECERRFEELDQHQKTFENLKQAQRNKIRLLKQKFKNEVSLIRDSEEESQARAEKINRTSQMFIKKLKFNREKYLMELKKVREMRQKALQGKKKAGLKFEAFESYSASPISNSGNNFRIIKEKFEREGDPIAKEFTFQ